MSDSDIRVILERLAVIETKIDMGATNTSNVDSDHEQRLRKLEAARWVLMGAAIALGGSSGALVSRLLG